MNSDMLAVARELGSLGVVILWSVGLWRWMHTDRKELTATLGAIRDAITALRSAHANDAEERRMLRDTMQGVTSHLARVTSYLRQQGALNEIHFADTRDIHQMVRDLARQELVGTTKRRSIDDIEREHRERLARLSEPPEE